MLFAKGIAVFAPRKLCGYKFANRCLPFLIYRFHPNVYIDCLLLIIDLLWKEFLKNIPPHPGVVWDYNSEFYKDFTPSRGFPFMPSFFYVSILGEYV